MQKLRLPMVMGALLLSACCAMSSCTSKQQQESTGQYLDSSVITTKVKAKLMADDMIPGSSITVTTYKNTVQLSGFVNNEYQKSRAVRLTKTVPGVTEVKDALEIKR